MFLVAVGMELSMRKYAVLLLILLLLILQPPAYAQASQTSRVSIGAYPDNVEVIIDERIHGQTPFEIMLPMGVHTFKFFSEGNERVKRELVFGESAAVWMDFSQPELSSSLIGVSSAPFYRMWASNLDKLVFVAGSIHPEGDLYIYDPIQEMLTTNQPYPDAVTDSQILSQLDYAFGTAPHTSPSGRFITYFSSKKLGIAAILDTKTMRSYDLNVPSEFYFPPSIERIFRITWSPHERYALIGGTRRYFGTYLAVENDTIRFITPISFKDARGNVKATDVSYARPTDDGRIIVNASDYEGNETAHLWVIDLNTLIGQPLPFTYDKASDAGFSEDGKYVVTALADRIIQYDLATRESRLLSTAFATIPSNFDIQVEFSDSLRFAFVRGSRGAWIYSTSPDVP
jgi:WD40 repeat protein